MQLHIRGLNTHVLDVQSEESISQVKARLAALENVEDAANLVLSCQGTILATDALVTDLSSIELDLTIPLLGGKVHGSLARAGKVRSQTPKVEKQEKQKKKTGRARRRSQYNRYFVNGVSAFGPGRGPNSNST